MADFLNGLDVDGDVTVVGDITANNIRTAASKDVIDTLDATDENSIPTSKAIYDGVIAIINEQIDAALNATY